MRDNKVVETLFHQRLSSTEIDRDGDKLTISQLKNLYGQMPESHVMGQAHDLSLPPVARAYNKSLEEVENGEHAIFVDIDIYDKAVFKKYKGYSLSYTTRHLTNYPELKPALELLAKAGVFNVLNEYQDYSKEEMKIIIGELKVRLAMDLDCGYIERSTNAGYAEKCQTALRMISEASV